MYRSKMCRSLTTNSADSNLTPVVALYYSETLPCIALLTTPYCDSLRPAAATSYILSSLTASLAPFCVIRLASPALNSTLTKARTHKSRDYIRECKTLHQGDDPYLTQYLDDMGRASRRKSEKPHLLQRDSERRVIIIGTGVAGLTQAISLNTKLRSHNFTIFEKGSPSEVGGVWRWSKSHGLQGEIQACLIELRKKCNLYPHIIFNTSVLCHAEWDDAKQQYSIIAEDIFSGKRTTNVAHVVIFALDILEIPNLPSEIPGVQKFQGAYSLVFLPTDP
ncbi:hypothetical protein EV424DRAFT_1619032 [Suillus variegatus]|nr:hypothetical protein EV424DRAFT_1619032 [Suillus variegatus]